jgi:circadian clock protein KaiC
VKRRTGNHERTLRRLSFGTNGIHVGEALREYRGLLTGVPVRVDDLARTLGGPDAGR